MDILIHNNLTLPLNDAHIYQRRGVVLAYLSQEPLHFTVLRCINDKDVHTYFGAARADNLQDFRYIMDFGDKFELISAWLSQQQMSPHG